MEHVKTLEQLAEAIGGKVWVNPRDGEARVYLNFGVRRQLGEKAFVKNAGGVAGLQLVIVGAGPFRRAREQSVEFELSQRGVRL